MALRRGTRLVVVGRLHRRRRVYPLRGGLGSRARLFHGRGHHVAAMGLDAPRRTSRRRRGGRAAELRARAGRGSERRRRGGGRLCGPWPRASPGVPLPDGAATAPGVGGRRARDRVRYARPRRVRSLMEGGVARGRSDGDAGRSHDALPAPRARASGDRRGSLGRTRPSRAWSRRSVDRGGVDMRHRLSPRALRSSTPAGVLREAVLACRGGALRPL